MPLKKNKSRGFLLGNASRKILTWRKRRDVYEKAKALHANKKCCMSKSFLNYISEYFIRQFALKTNFTDVVDIKNELRQFLYPLFLQ